MRHTDRMTKKNDDWQQKGKIYPFIDIHKHMGKRYLWVAGVAAELEDSI